MLRYSFHREIISVPLPYYMLKLHSIWRLVLSLKATFGEMKLSFTDRKIVLHEF